MTRARLYIREWRMHLGKPFDGLVAAAGKEQSSVYRYESGAVTPPPDVLARVADYFAVPIGDLYRPPAADDAAEIAPTPPHRPIRGDLREAAAPLPDITRMPRDVPVLGTAQGGKQGSFTFTSSGAIDYVRRPPGLDGAPRAYAFYVDNDSMAPMHSPGELRFAHPDRKPRIGDTVVVQVKNGEEEPILAYIKLLKKRDDDSVVLEQLNPPMSLTFPAGTVIKIHKVLTMNELFEV